jgi:molybdopterin-guanine dinucleotide biosynthesis protein A
LNSAAPRRPQPGNGNGPPTDPNGPITALILCGGAGTRVRGADKPLLELDGRPLVEHVLARIAPQVATVLISANRNEARYARYGAVVSDGLPGFAGPLVGVLAGLQTCSTPWLLACAGDTPDLPQDLVTRLRAALRDATATPTALAAIARVGEHLEPLPALLHRSTAASLSDYLAQGKRSVHGWLATLPLAIADFCTEQHAFSSLNSPADFAAAQGRRQAAQSPICD